MKKKLILRRPLQKSAAKPEPKVGYCSPPVHAQFKPGRSGNPKGRPKGAKTVNQLFLEESLKTVKVKTSSGVTQVAKARQLVRSTIDDALRGDVQAKKLSLSHLSAAHAERQVTRSKTSVTQEPPFTAVELEAINQLNLILGKRK
jgi:hypothetical protein